MVICDHNCERCRFPDCVCEELTAEEIRRSDELDNAILRSRGEFGRGGRHPQPRVEQESGATVRQWRERNGLSLESAAFVIGVAAWTMRYIESGGPVPEEEWQKVARYVEEHCEVAAEEAYTPQVLARQLMASRASSPFRVALRSVFLSCWDDLCTVCGKSGAECQGCKWQREEAEKGAEVSA